MAIFTEETQKKILAAMQETTALTKIIANGWNVDSWKAVQAIVQAGAGAKYFPVGTMFDVASTTYGTIRYVVVAHDHHKCPEDESKHSMTLMQVDVIYNRMFDQSEYLWANTGDSELAAGTYNITCLKADYNQDTKEDGTYQLTITKAIPAGGGIRHTQMGAWRSAYDKSYVLSGTWTTYDADGNTLESGLACTEGSGGTNLGTASVAQANIVNTIGRFNSTQRCAYGSNHWGESAIRQWINSSADANAWWQAQTPFDVKPSYANVKGYVADLDAEFVGILGEVELTTAYNAIYNYDGNISGSYMTRDKFFLASRVELGFGPENGISEGSVLEYYDGADNTDRIKYDISSKTSARYWWMRSPDPWIAYNARLVDTSGALDRDYAYIGYGCVPACVIY